MYEGIDGKKYHQVGMFFTHFMDDLSGVTDALIAGGYSVCQTLDGDMIIMKQGDYDEDDEDEEDDDDDDNNHWGYKFFNFPKEY